MFRGMERDPCDVWSLVMFYVTLWASVSNISFCNYALVLFHSFSTKAVVSIYIYKKKAFTRRPPLSSSLRFG